MVVDGHGCHTALNFGVKAKENHDKVPTLYWSPNFHKKNFKARFIANSSSSCTSKLPTLYWLPQLHKRPYKSRFIANSSACTTTELSILLTSCLTTIKNHVIKYCTTVYERNGKKLWWSIKNSGEVPN